jgi:four helix bundle suffix protein
LSTASTASTRSTPPTYAGLAANAALVLINVPAALLDRQISSQTAAFANEGGFTERLYRLRSEKRHAPWTPPNTSA